MICPGSWKWPKFYRFIIDITDLEHRMLSQCELFSLALHQPEDLGPGQEVQCVVTTDTVFTPQVRPQVHSGLNRVQFPFSCVKDILVVMVSSPFQEKPLFTNLIG